jgi:hypothetical protein
MLVAMCEASSGMPAILAAYKYNKLYEQATQNRVHHVHLIWAVCPLSHNVDLCGVADAGLWTPASTCILIHELNWREMKNKMHITERALPFYPSLRFVIV